MQPSVRSCLGCWANTATNAAPPMTTPIWRMSILRENPQLVLLDINLPVFDGYCVCRELRRRSQIPIIVVTSRDSDADELMSMNLGRR